MVFVLLRAFANGGSSLTGIEAVSNAVSAFRPPEGINARKVLVTEGLILGSLVAGISWLAHATHAAPYVSGVPTVISQETKIVFGHSVIGHDRVHLRPGGHRADPVHRRQHQLQRLPVPGQLRGRGRVPAPLADQARPPAGVLQRDRGAGRAVVHPAGRGRGERQQAWCRSTRSGSSPRSPWPGFGMAKYHHKTQGVGLAAPAGDQLLGGRDVGDRRGDLRRGQVHRGRVAGRGAVRRSACPR